ncbi:2-hydroxyacid dehydrogenase [Undibacterium fentianense]|uniref:D-glycerate dehydrogenase n=1 Tax=Undibacterium fentianense TaxID=2828728 RepID=A0A941E384_9BURK|nr:D-glycerate dehydrogenase [Undibacterium fentianense]MBR7798898.1 D-glycerate dehydrogenase [Undibacterium fentianense]
MRPKLLVARAMFPDLLSRLTPYFDLEINQEDRIFTEDELIERLHGKFGMICTSSAKISSSLLQRLKSINDDLKIISTIAVGYDNFDIASCTENRVMATNSPDVLNETTADFAWALMMATARRVTEAEAFLRDGEWKKWSVDFFLGADIHGSTLGILGMGRIGQAIARRAAGFGMQVIYHNRQRLDPDIELKAHCAEYVDRETLFSASDHLILALPFTPEVRHSIGVAEISRMKRSATLINIARGGIVDEDVLIDALRTGQIAGAGLDVFENEPNFNRAFLDLKNVVLTPHIASASEQTRRAMVSQAINNVIAAVKGEIPPNLINRQALHLGFEQNSRDT